MTGSNDSVQTVIKVNQLPVISSSFVTTQCDRMKHSTTITQQCDIIQDWMTEDD